ncbi:Alkaline_phosphatase [Hexamita inflata]|uniref:Alkaline phosphatase n=1 Tax=Hexamita inflata TaxID=28002 RepID=A0AA86TZG7_9EUKA|nr:Alkaline phosphatase [Hexamita inflata]
MFNSTMLEPTKHENMNQNHASLSQKTYKLRIILTITSIISTLIFLTLAIFCTVQYIINTNFLTELIVTVLCFTLSLIFSIYLCVKKQANKLQILMNISTVIIMTTLSIALGIEVIVKQLYYLSLPLVPSNYGPLAFIHENGTRIHWCTNELAETNLKADQKYLDKTQSNYHSVFVNNNEKFDYSLYGYQKKHKFNLPPVINKFIVMADIQTVNTYISTMDEDYDFNVLCGDYSYSGLMSEYGETFSKMHTKPVLMVQGNHDEPTTDFIDSITQRPMNYFQKVRNIGFFFIYINNGHTDIAMDYLNNNYQKAIGFDHVFIVVHHPIYSTGEFGSFDYLTQEMETFIDGHPELNIRGIFTGHDHLFAAFKRNNIFYFVNGAGGAGIDQMTNPSVAYDRIWAQEELHGPLSIINQNCLGYQYHLDSWMKFTRTEVTFAANKVNYTIRDLVTKQVLVTYDQVI